MPSTPSAKSTSISRAGLYLQLGAFQQRRSAIELQSRVSSLLAEAVNIEAGNDNLHRVTLGPVATERQIALWQQILQSNGMATGYMVRR